MKSLYQAVLLLILHTQVFAQWHLTETETINTYRQLNGEIEAINKATVSSQTTGRVEKLYYDVDDFVAKGSIIVEFTNTEQKALLRQVKANAQAAKIAFKQAVTDYNRTKEIYAKKLVAKSKLDQALSTQNALMAKSVAADAAVTQAEKLLEYTVIRAPYDGIVTNRYIEQGETVNPGTAIMEGLSLNKLRVVTHIPEKIINKVKANPQAKILLEGRVIEVSDITIFPYADRLTRTFKTRIDLEADETQLFPGMTIKVAFKVGETQAILVPKSAIITRSELTMVYVKSNKGNKGKILRHVKLGSSDNVKIEIISGLNAGEEVLINPLSELAGN
jgi:RND family efflux transporter MFP subunit